MPSWNQLLDQFSAQPNDPAKHAWLTATLDQKLGHISARRGGRNVIFYASAFLQKPMVPAPFLQITHEEINGLMSVMHGMQWEQHLTLLLHTPGGMTNATETIVDYLLSKFADIEVIVPTLAMSAGTMISLAANRVIMGRQSQLGPIDPQMPVGGRAVSARAVVEQFDQAKKEILADLSLAHVWAPILPSLGPALLVEAQNALDYSEKMVARWLEARMFSGDRGASSKAAAVAKHFNDATTHKSHGRRIDREEARRHGVNIVDLEADQELQDDVLTAYHLITLMMENSLTAKVMANNAGRLWVKNVGP
jgi:hypothetical protein